MCLDAQAMRSYAAAKGWQTRRRRDRAKPFEEGGISFMPAGGGSKKRRAGSATGGSVHSGSRDVMTRGRATGNVASDA